MLFKLGEKSVTAKRKIFTLQEAEGLLPELETRLKDLLRKKEAYSRTHDHLFMHELVCAAERSNGFFEDQADLEEGIRTLEEAIEGLAKDVEAIFAKGCFLRNIDKGYIEFFGCREGQDIFFSWQLGEPKIGFFRPAGQKINVRIPL